jgi:hypothetical protein
VEWAEQIAVVEEIASFYDDPRVGRRRLFYPRMREQPVFIQDSVYDLLTSRGKLRDRDKTRGLPAPYTRTNGRPRLYNGKPKVPINRARVREEMFQRQVDKLKAELDALKVELKEERSKPPPAPVTVAVEVPAEPQVIDTQAIGEQYLTSLSPQDLLNRLPLDQVVAHAAGGLARILVAQLEWTQYMADALTAPPPAPATSVEPSPNGHNKEGHEEPQKLKIAIYSTKSIKNMCHNLEQRFQGAVKFRFYDQNRYLDIKPEGSAHYCVALANFSSHTSTASLKGRWPSERFFVHHGNIDTLTDKISKLVNHHLDED